jgi:signal transduction histidine kinase
LRTRRLSLALRQRRDDLEAFIHAMAHDLRAPVRVTAGFAGELLADENTTLSLDGRSCLQKILSATDDMQQLMTSLLEFSRLGRDAVRLRRLSLQQVVARCLRNLQDEIQATRAHITISEEQAILYADPTLLKVALTNLIANALKFVAPGVPPHVTISAAVTQYCCRLHVEDNGIGVSPEDQARIFQPFVRLHAAEEYPGSGLGLATVQKAVELMGGRVGVTSTPDKGSTFWIELRGPGVSRELLDC